ncbi:radical SAM protein [Dactylosporangium sp. CA-233914]|uniref:radical SAM/SPASM domain-containing protein n=1 Tax=Dactylosporangium sp. CA-233914 TaxID=3239934 RepID=UPI003D8F40B1
MPSLPAVLRAAPRLRIRIEHFGALAWTTRPRRIHDLGPVATVLTTLYAQPLDARLDAVVSEAVRLRFGITDEAVAATVQELWQQGVLVASDAPACPLDPIDVHAAADAAAATRPEVKVLKPFWVHLQPFTRCNQHCVTCYCSGGPKADPFLHPVEQWKSMIDKLDAYGVLDVYITGGESLLYLEFFDLAEHILGKGMGFGLSTNATVLGGGRLERLQALQFSPVQVSLDGGTAATHELIRGVPGCWPKTLAGIRAIGAFAKVVINTVVNRMNLAELEQVVQVGIGLGVRRFKFFPQKPVGRANPAVTLDDTTIVQTLLPRCAELAARYEVDIESIDPKASCGSGSIGFAVDQRADIHPCIFGVENPDLVAGNLRTDDLDTVWFGSPVFAPFRGEVGTVCRRCEQPCR